MIERLVIAVLVFLAAFVAVGLFLPDEAQTERVIDIDRPVVTVFTLLNRPDSFRAWAPWAKRDPSARLKSDPSASGVGSVLEWTGDPRLVGRGRLEITESNPNALVRSRVTLQGQGDAESVFRIERVAGGSRLSWQVRARMSAEQSWFSNLLARYFGLLFDRWMGAEVEQGLLRFKSYVETLPRADFSGLEVERVLVEGGDVLGVELPGTKPGAERVAAAYGEISSFMSQRGIGIAGAPLFIRLSGGESGVSHLAAVPAVRNGEAAEGRVRWRRTPSGPALRVEHRGAYETLPEVHAKLAAWLAAHGYERGNASWEQYVSNPAETPPSGRITRVYVLLAAEPEGSSPAVRESD